jgi:protein SERAC1
LVHGIGGHPVRSWKCQGRAQIPTTPNSTLNLSSTRRRLRKNPPITTLRRSNSEPLLFKEQDQNSSSKARSTFRKNSSKSSSRLKLADFVEATEHEQRGKSGVYWPLSLLPESCPNARIFTWGYHTLVADNKPLRLQSDIFAHAGELLLELASVRAARGAGARPVIFIAHSTGGTLVKEVINYTLPAPRSYPHLTYYYCRPCECPKQSATVH